MSVLSVFGQNLRQLTAGRGSISGVAGELAISRVQFQRLLRGDAYPKPQMLDQICRYFGTDARILLQPLEQIAALDRLQAPILPEGVPKLDPEIALMMGWALRGQNYSLTQTYLPDGLYRYWVADGYEKDTYHCMPAQVSSRVGRFGPAVTSARSLRAYFHRAAFGLPGEQNTAARREVRGMLFRVPDGVIMLAFNPDPVLRVTMMHLTPNPLFADGSFIGFVAWGRAEIVGFGRVSRCFMQRVPPTPRDILACARIVTPMTGAQVPPQILQHLNQPVERSNLY